MMERIAVTNPVMAPETGPQRVRPIVIVGGTVLVVMMISFLLYAVGGSADQELFTGGQAAGTAGPVSNSACGLGTPDDSYSVALVSDPDPPRPEGTTFRLTVRQGGRAVTGAKVCMLAEMPTMEHPGLSGVAKELSGGRYESVVKFGMGGSWKAAVTIAEPGKPTVSVTVPIEVKQVEPE